MDWGWDVTNGIRVTLERVLSCGVMLEQIVHPVRYLRSDEGRLSQVGPDKDVRDLSGGDYDSPTSVG